MHHTHKFTPESFSLNSIYLLTGYEGIASLLSPRHLTIDWGEAEVNSQGRGDNKLAIPEYTVYKYFIIPKNITHSWMITSKW